MNLEKLKYPIGKRTYDPNNAHVMKNTWIESIQGLPEKLEKATAGISEDQLNLIYRPEAWTVAQVVNHLADSHMNAFLRFKFAMAEDHPHVKGYEENDWAQTVDAKNLNLKPSLDIIRGIHARWTQVLQNMDAKEFERTYHHLSYKSDWTLMSVLNLYAWHSDHHLAHVHQALKLNGNFE